MTYRRRLDGAINYLKDPKKLEQLDRDERRYKNDGAESTRQGLDAFLKGQTDAVDIQRGLNLLDWRTKDDLSEMIKAHPDLFREALKALWSDQQKFSQADHFWRILDPALNTLSEDKQKRFESINARTSIVSYFLFVANPKGHPFYQVSFSAKAIQALYDRSQGLDKRDIETLLRDFVGRCQYVHQQFQEAGLPYEDMIDTQSALYILAQEYFGRK